MRFVPTRIHGVIDYLTGILLIVAPWLFHFQNAGAGTWLPVVLGVMAIVYSLVTAYECGIFPVLPMPVHLVLDAISGILLAVSPWLFGFAAIVWMPHLVIGLFEIAMSAMTHTLPRGIPARGVGATTALR